MFLFPIKPAIEINNLKKVINNICITRGVNLIIPSGTCTVIIGKSGEGKSLLLKQIMGLVAPTSGSIIINGINVLLADNATRTKVYQQMGYVFQYAALFDSLTVFDNIALSLIEQKIDTNIIKQRVHEAIEIVGLSLETLKKYPPELSGGMCKRVGFARAIILKPRILLYDEPTAGLDPASAHLIHQLIASMQHDYGITSIMVSHDPESLNVADYVAYLNEGMIEYHASVHELSHTNHPFMMHFFNRMPGAAYELL